jgi:hypothetical protein
MNVVEQVQSTEASEVRESQLALEFPLYYGQHKIYNMRAPNLYFNGVCIVAKKKL